MKNQLKARVSYVGKNNTDFSDGYALIISSDGGKTWGMSLFSPCRNMIDDNPGQDPEYIHFTILQEIYRAQKLGYKVEFDLGTPYKTLAAAELGR